MITENSRRILKEIEKVFSISDFSKEDALVECILSSKKIVCVGAGRMGYALRGFSMRLKHLGLDAYMLGDTNVPSIKGGDLLIAGSGSGETLTILNIVQIAKKNGSRIALITGNPDSSMGRLSDTMLILRAPSKIKKLGDFVSEQPMTTLNEQSIGILLDSLVMTLMEKTGETNESMWRRHSNLE